jgi:hypothetical protein
LEAFQNGLNVSTDPNDIQLFGQQIADVKKVKEQMKNDLIQLITEPKFSPSDVKLDLKIQESGPNVSGSQPGPHPKEPRKFTRRATAPDHSIPSFDFINLKDIDGKILTHPDHNVNENESDSLNRSVHFAPGRESSTFSKQQPSKGILKGGLRRQVTTPPVATKLHFKSEFDGLD